MSQRLLFLLALLAITVMPTYAGGIGVFPSKTWDIRQIRLGDDSADPPFYALVQSHDGIIYASDRRGVIEFDGMRWRRLPLGSRTAVTLLGITRSGALVVGGAEFLYVLEDPGDPSSVVDVAKAFPDGLHGSGDFWEFAEDEEQWCARSVALLVCESDSRFRAFTTQREFGRMFGTSEGILIHIDGVGLNRVTSNGPQPVPGGEAFVGNGISSLSELSEGALAAIANRPPSLWRWRLGETPAQHRVFERTDLSMPIGLGVVVAPNRFAVPEDTGGVAILDQHGRIEDRIEPADLGVGAGAQALMVDREGALWIAWRSAISRVEYPSRMRMFPLPQNLFGQSLSLTRTRLGITTFHGGKVLTLREGADSKRWAIEQHGPLLPAILMLGSSGGSDFAGTIQGFLPLDGGVPAIPSEIVLSHSEAIGHPGGLWVGRRYGVSRLMLASEGWLESERSARVSFDVISILQTEPRTLWLGSLVGRVARLHLESGKPLADASIEEYDEAAGLPKATISIERIGDDAMFWAQGGRFYEFRNGRFEASGIVPFEESGPIQEVKRIDDAQLLISNPNSRLRLLRRDITGVYRHQRSIFDEIASVEKTRSMHVDPDGIVWLAQDSNVVRIDPQADVPKLAPQQVLIRDVSVGGLSLLNGSGDGTALALDEGSGLRVEYTLPSYRAPELNRFRSRIRSLHAQAEWSGWSNETRRDFTNLPAGELLFEVEAQDAAGVSGGIAAVPITVIAPWYRRTWAAAVFVAAGLLLVWLGVQWRLRALRARGAELERLVALKTEALQVAANTDPLTGLWNRHRFGQWLRHEAAEITADATSARAEDPADVIVCVIDLDHFKRINDQHGHAAGDLVLKAVAERLQAMRRPDDWVFRFGGEEFVYLGTRRHLYEGRPLAEAIVREIAQIQVELEGGVLLDPTASVGWSVYPLYRQRADLFSLDYVLGIADRALYVAKEEGRNRACGYVANLPVDEIDRTQADWRTQAFQRHPDFLQRV